MTGTGPHSHLELLNDVWHSADGITWIQDPSAPWEPRMGQAVASFNGKVWISGGWKRGSDPHDPHPYPDAYLNDVWCMTPVTASISVANGAWRQEGEPLDLKLVTSGLSGPITYQWRKDGSAIAGATTDAFHVDTATASDAASYTCEAKDQYGAVFTADAIEIQVFPAGSLPASSTILAVLGGCACLIVGIRTLLRRRPLLGGSRTGRPDVEFKRRSGI